MALRFSRTIAACSAVALLSSSATAKSASSSSDLVVTRAAGGEQELESRGFRNLASFQSGSDGAGTVWWNGRTKQCLQFLVVGGRVDSVTDIGTHPDCR